MFFGSFKLFGVYFHGELDATTMQVMAESIQVCSATETLLSPFNVLDGWMDGRSVNVIDYRLHFWGLLW